MKMLMNIFPKLFDSNDRKIHKYLFQSLSLAIFLAASSTVYASYYAYDITMGAFQTTEVGIQRGFNLNGQAMMVRNKYRGTKVYSTVAGLREEAFYASHIHNLPCSLGGGAHYKIDPNVDDTVEANELWPVLSFNNATRQHSGAVSSFETNVPKHVARPEAQSVVIHDTTDGARIACADLVNSQIGSQASQGTFVITQVAIERGMVIKGLVTMLRSAEGTLVNAVASGLLPDLRYGAHIHNLPCSLGGGAHYKIDPAEETTIEENEIWPTLTSDSNGNGLGTAQTNHIARPEAQSMVIHDPEDGARLACADLIPKQKKELITQGQAIITTEGMKRGYVINARAKMDRTKRGGTRVFLKVSGLAPWTNYPAHVHVKNCGMGGGVHYKIDDTVAETLAENEIWPLVRTNWRGKSSRFRYVYGHIARPEAQSIVIHDPKDGARIACVDLDQ